MFGKHTKFEAADSSADSFE